MSIIVHNTFIIITIRNKHWTTHTHFDGDEDALFLFS